MTRQTPAKSMRWPDVVRHRQGWRFAVASLTMLSLFTFVALESCGRKQAPVPAEAPSPRLPYLHLQAGWRLSIVSPLHSAQLPALDVSEATEGGGEAGARSLVLEAKAPEGFGYIQAFVLLRKKSGAVSFQFDSAQLHQGETVSEISLPVNLQGIFPPTSGLARILFLTRAADADHDMAVLQAAGIGQLNSLMERVLRDPATGCVTSATAWCKWVPPGVAVRVEKRNGAAKTPEWIPVL